ncbi:hypothetical protein EG68_04391 [Paragonimus skrjabini miyazakii]|uniref:Uncharacterized protein n=1 Tax=Paragonimus skrjabini miyazakii TaxID=59628 RepID=A0A8S9YU82_9TREM|nr:hypothetical protein EG68_04391 [Paragonimus skrjabini miyazakii]
MVQSVCGKPIFHGPDPNDYALTSPHDAVSEVVLTSHLRHKQSSYGGAPLVEQKDSQPIETVELLRTNTVLFGQSNID